MTCQYCSEKNEPDDHRCQRCGRRLQLQASSAPVNRSSLAHQLEVNEAEAPEVAARPAPSLQLVSSPPVTNPSDQKQPLFQASLFGPQEVSKANEEIPDRRTSSGVSRHRLKRDSDSGQQSLDFVGAIPQAKHTLRTSVEARIYCDAPVAVTPMRVVATIADCAIGAAGVGVFLTAQNYMGLPILLTKPAIMSYLISAVLISLLYRILYCIANKDTIGVQWAGMKILDFDGRVPTRQQRFRRLASSLVSIVPAGLGLVWALFDEERLTWHDQMSETFATAAEMTNG
jgi:uncharacterized RDD family membrane protein YckC